MPDYNPSSYSPGFGGVIDSAGNIKNIADVIQNGKVEVNAAFTLSPGDISIGAVEISDGADPTKRLAVNADGSLNMRVIGSIDGGGF